MNAKSARLAHRSQRREARKQRPAAARFALTVMLGTLGAFLWVLPTAQAEGLGDRASATGMVRAAPAVPMQVAALQPAEVPLPQAPLTVAANATARAAGSSRDLAMVRGGKGPNCTGEVGDQSTVTVPLGKSTLVNLGE